LDRRLGRPKSSWKICKTGRQNFSAAYTVSCPVRGGICLKEIKKEGKERSKEEIRNEGIG
jgi:hypothetical protein